MNAKNTLDHLLVNRYGEFELTDAVRPGPDLQVVPRQGFRISTYRDSHAGLEVPVLAAAVSRDSLFDLFLDLLDPLGQIVNVVLETSHESSGNRHRDLFRSHIDLPVLKSHFYEFEEMLLNDGCTGVAVVSRSRPIEVQFDEHKLLIAYARDLGPFARILAQGGVVRDDHLKLISEGEHLHTTDPTYSVAFKQLCQRLGVGGATERVNW